MQEIPDVFWPDWVYGVKSPSLFVRIASLWSQMENALAQLVRRGLPKAGSVKEYYDRRSMSLFFDALVLASRLNDPNKEQAMLSIIDQWCQVLADLLDSREEVSEAPANFLMGLPGWVNQYLQYFAGVSYKRRYEMASRPFRHYSGIQAQWSAKSLQESLNPDERFNVAA